MDREDNSSSSPDVFDCNSSDPGRSIFTSWFSLYLLLLPVFLLVLYIGFRKWRRSAAGGLSHSDVFTLHMVLMETFCVFGSCLYVYGSFRLNLPTFKAGGGSVISTLTGQMLFHVLTCVERYLAVVHPVSYLRLRVGGASLRNTCITLVWVFCLAFTFPLSIVGQSQVYTLSSFVLSIAAMALVTYCSVFVLRVLGRPKPGEVGGNRRQVDQSKRATVYTMAAIMGALLLRVTAYIVYGCIRFLFWSSSAACVVLMASLWATLPSSLVLPLLFLHRARKLHK